MGHLLLGAMMAVGGGTPSAASAGPAVAVVVIEGQVVKVDLSNSELIVKVAGPREMVVVVEKTSTRLSRQGRAVGLVDVRSGEKVSVSCENVRNGRCQARFIKVGTWKLPGSEARKGAE